MADQKKIDERELGKLLELHKKYLRSEGGGSRLILRGADLQHADLSGAAMKTTDMRGTDFAGAKLQHADLSGANLADAITKDASDFPFVPSIVPDAGSFVGWKKAYYGEDRPCVVKLLIPAGAKRSSGMGRKCRCSKAKVLAIESLAGRPLKCKAAHSGYRRIFEYEVGKTVKADAFDENRFRECAPGIHFFLNREEAVRY